MPRKNNTHEYAILSLEERKDIYNKVFGNRDTEQDRWRYISDGWDNISDKKKYELETSCVRGLIKSMRNNKKIRI